MIGDTSNIAFAARGLVLGLSLGLLLAFSTARVHSDAGDEDEIDLLPIWVLDEKEELHKFVIEDNDVRGYAKGMEPEEIEIEIDGQRLKSPDGFLSICEVSSFRGIHLAISQLWPDEIPNRADFEVTWAHPGPRWEQNLRYMLGEAARYHRDVPEGTSSLRLTPKNYGYAVTNLKTGDSFEARVADGVFPRGFFELWTKMNLGGASDTEEAEWTRQFEEVRRKFLMLEADGLFEYEEREGQGGGVPIWQLAFALGLTGTVAVAVLYPIVVRRKGASHSRR